MPLPSACLKRQPQGGTQRAAMTVLQEGVLDGDEVESPIVRVGEVAAPQLQAVMAMFPRN